ncbi:hypothetical protein, conserved [Eimeria necatrix]|uniref:DUF6832 domain-containing protein n=1 Tax=Eimeria necatrix TaxID=51315 RepID=U6MR50_9EIME|nr:hypothetical protein, conserved [Eimeria necatrix]CDJ65538.1 hypothetical protein, conserved [Eimeria necatrix]
MYDAAIMPKRLRKIKVFIARPPDSLPIYFHEKLSKANSNPRSIIKLYRRYMKLDDEIDYKWLVRCFCQLGNVFGFNSFWAPRDKQQIHSLPSFKCLVYDLIERREQIQLGFAAGNGAAPAVRHGRPGVPQLPFAANSS